METVLPAGRLVRYADDFVIFCKSKHEAQEILCIVERWLSKRGLQLSPEKTRIVHLKDGFDFLGFNVRLYHTPGRKRMTKNPLFENPREGNKILIKPSRSNLSRVKQKIKDVVRKHLGAPQAAVIAQLNPIIRGWAAYFSIGVSSRAFALIDNYTWNVLWKWARQRHRNKGRVWIAARYWGKHASGRDAKWVFGFIQPNGRSSFLYKMAWTKIQRHIMVVGKSSPDDPSLADYWTRRRTKPLKYTIGFRQTLSLLQKGLCPHCGGLLDNGEELHVHHKIPRSQGGDDHILNMQLVHMYCHQQIHAHLNVRTA